MRALDQFTSVAVGAMQALQVYTIGGEWEFTVEAMPGQEPSEALLAEVQTLLDRTMDAQRLDGGPRLRDARHQPEGRRGHRGRLRRL